MTRLRPEIHPLLTGNVIDALRAKRVFSVADFIKTDTLQIVTIARLNFKEVRAVKKFLLKQFAARPINGFDCYKSTLANTAIMSTGIQGVDKLLNGGLFTGNIYEICGFPISGKTQFVLTLTKNVLRSTTQKIYYFDTKHDFSAVKLKQFLDEQDPEREKKLLSQVEVMQTYTRYDLINALYRLKTNLNKELKIRLIIIDSLPGIMFSSNDYTSNDAFINRFVNVVRFIAVEHQIAFVITNLITTWREPDSQEQTKNERIACGRFWSSVPNTRLQIEKTENGYKLCVLSSDTPRNGTDCVASADIVLSQQGFREVHSLEGIK